MDLKDYLLNNTLTIDKDCYYNFDRYTYKGTNEEGKHILSKLQGENNIEIQIVKTPFVPQLPLDYIFKAKEQVNLLN
ncbi:hypothetical protein [Niallia taxi]|uniref:hypothetical protein n=1 Tax=Niallia taxi TaxID=2499688 RepID=UPI003008D899